MRYLLKNPDELGLVLGSIAHGYRLGCRAEPLLAQKWEEHWDRPLAQWRAQLNITEALEESPYAVEVDGEVSEDETDEVRSDSLHWRVKIAIMNP